MKPKPDWKRLVAFVSTHPLAAGVAKLISVMDGAVTAAALDAEGKKAAAEMKKLAASAQALQKMLSAVRAEVNKFAPKASPLAALADPEHDATAFLLAVSEKTAFNLVDLLERLSIADEMLEKFGDAARLDERLSARTAPKEKAAAALVATLGRLEALVAVIVREAGQYDAMLAARAAEA